MMAALVAALMLAQMGLLLCPPHEPPNALPSHLQPHVHRLRLPMAVDWILVAALVAALMLAQMGLLLCPPHEPPNAPP